MEKEETNEIKGRRKAREKQREEGSSETVLRLMCAL
jgi:hypothetical protein